MSPRTGKCVKVGYRDQATAVAAAEVSARAATLFGREGQRPLRAYKCPTCRRWHLSSKAAL